MSLKFIITYLIIFVLISVSSVASFNVKSNELVPFVAFGKTNQTDLTLPIRVNLHDIETKKIHVGDIDIAYKEFGKGDPILLISGAWGPLDYWDHVMLGKLASNHTVITFDNRGIGNTSSGNKLFSIRQFANDTVGLMDALKIKKANVLGWSMGGMIAQELALGNPEKVKSLILYGSACVGNETIASPQVMRDLSNSTGTSVERFQRFMPLMFPQQWRNENPNFPEKLPRTAEIIQNKTLDLQVEAVNRCPGVCTQLGHINQPTLVILGTDDLLTSPANSLLIAERIPGVWLVQIAGAGHALALQYPEKFSDVVITFLESQ